MLIIKIGGGKKIDWDYICEDICELVSSDQKIIIVHGASEKRNEIAAKLGFPTKIVTSPSGVSSVLTDRHAIEIFLMAYAGLVNKQIVEQMLQNGINAVGLSGVDGRLWQAKKKGDILVQENGKTKLVKGNLTGRVEKVNHQLLNLLLDNGYVPVISAPAISFENEIVNTDNDIAAALMAGTLGIKKIIVLFEAPGMLRDINDPQSLIKKLKEEELENCMKFAIGRMKKKLLGAQKALALGVKKIYWGDGRIKHPILKAIKGNGTVIG